MASRAQIQKLTSKAIFDNGFRYRFLHNPKKAAAELKITLTKDEVAYIKSLNGDELNTLAASVQYITHTESGAVHWR